MGTTYSVKVDCLPNGTTADQLKEQIDQRLERLNDLMSTYRQDSELQRFGRDTGTDWFDVSPETAAVVAEALRISRLSGGAFDATVAPLVNLWNFGPDAKVFRIPSDQEIAEAKKHVGFEEIDVQLTPPALRKQHPDVTLDLSGIAKGFAVDQIAEYLDRLKVAGYLVEIGGETRTKGLKRDETLWKVGIQRPTEFDVAIQKIILLGNRSLATSGDYRNYFEQDGQRFSHTIDPRTGRPIAFRLASVSVVTDSCMTADALATAFMVLGPEASYNLAVQQQLAVLFVIRSEKGFVERATPAFQQFLGTE